MGYKRYVFTREESVKGGKSTKGNKRKVRKGSYRLCIEDWLYHIYHLDSIRNDVNEPIKDCKICCWYNKLKDETKEQYKRSQS